ncbi:MAG TPA: ABC transporter ATP-binding protein, partial [Saprospiraceae bacterium]|nr:ABC transporter ATP-binding protein [Saprospiraceae bacterium]
GSILENITLGRPDVPLAKVLKTIEEVGLTDFVREQAAGIQTELLPTGKNLPGSVVSKMVVARAVVTEPNLLVMEDPTQSLNYRDRLRISQLLTDRSHPWTLVTVTEDPVLAALCERVLVLREGRIVFDGSFDEVCKTDHFSKIFRTNADLEEIR